MTTQRTLSNDKVERPTNHTVTLINRFGNSITAPVVYVKPLGNGQAEVLINRSWRTKLLSSNSQQPLHRVAVLDSIFCLLTSHFLSSTTSLLVV